MKRILLGLCLWAALWPGVAGAEQVFVRNHPFKGPVSGSGDSTMVGLEAIAQELGLTLTQVNGGWCVGAPAEAVQPGQVLAEGTPVESSSGPNGEVMVSLKSLGKAVGARVTRNPGMGSIDVYLVKASTTAPASPTATTTTPRPAPPPVADTNAGEIVHLNKSGEAVDVAAAAVHGKTTIIAFDAPW